jgi:glucosamine 6-phosphate synthetase-like amidotransferase/phosphosugar isomerase protein
VGVVILDHPVTSSLACRLATDTARLGSPTWLLTSDDIAQDDRLMVTRLPAVPDPLTPLPYSVAIQQLAARVAVLRGREPGALFRATKVTANE